MLVSTSGNYKSKEINSFEGKDHFLLDLSEIRDYSFKIASSPILIGSDDDFLSYGLPGNGSETNPFLIQNLEIETDSDFGIFIRDTTLNFVIFNCSVSASATSIHLFNNTGSYSSINNNHFTNSAIYGIYVFLCPNLTISNNTCAYTQAGIGVFYSNYSKIVNNLCYDNEYGIIGGGAEGTIITNNYCVYNLKIGINQAYSKNINLQNNFCSNTRIGIDLYSVEDAILSENTIEYSDNGFTLSYLKNITVIRNNIVFTYIGIDNHGTYGVDIVYNNCSAGTYGIWTTQSQSSLIDHNICNNNTRDGIYLRSSGSCLVVNNTCNDNLDNGMYVFRHERSDREDNQIISNTCNNNTYGINLYVSSSFFIFNNTCNENRYGMKLEDSSNNEIISNAFQENREYGVCITDFESTWNRIYGNYFICNNLAGTEYGFSQAYDRSYNNRWYDFDSNTGNFWTDYEGEGEYSIDGKYNMTDPYPFEYYFECITTETITEPTEESSLSLLTVVLSFIGTMSIAKMRYKKERRYKNHNKRIR